MAAALRVDPKGFFTATEWARVSRRSSWRGLWLVLHCWASIILAGALFVLLPNPLTFILAVMAIGTRQLGLAILVHEAAHGALHPNLKVNDAVAAWFCAAPVGANLARYRPYHLKHHKYAQQPEDPDLGLSAPFPISPASLRRKMLRDLSGRTFVKQRITPTIEAFTRRADRGQTLGEAAKGAFAFWRDFLLANLAIAVGLALLGVWWAYPLLWILPMAVWYPLVTRLRNIAEHACTPSNVDPLRHARTTRANLLERLLIAPYYVNYHCEHHMFMHVPCWNLPLAHRILRAKGRIPEMEVRSGYLEVLRLAASGGAGRGASASPGSGTVYAPPFG
jgi:fatty acid desaturase